MWLAIDIFVHNFLYIKILNNNFSFKFWYYNENLSKKFTFEWACDRTYLYN